MFVLTANYYYLGSTSDQILVGDDTPVITSVTPSVWQPGTGVPIVILRGNLSSNPCIVISDGVGSSPCPSAGGVGSNVTISAASDNEVDATVSVPSTAPQGPHALTVISTGFSGNNFQAAPGCSEHK